jgi:hypothetical protein
MADKRILRNRRNGGRGRIQPPGDPDGTEMFQSIRYSNHDSRKRRPVRKVHKNGNNQSKVA